MGKEVIESLIIKHVHIEGIWKKYTVDFFLNDDVNILVGDNGVGKTTILDIIAHICANQLGIFKYIDRSFQSAIIQFSDECRAVVETDEKGEKVVSWYRENIIVDYKDLPIGIDVVSTFDSSRFPESVETEIKSSHDDIRSELDLMLYFAVNDLYRYVSMLSKMSRKYLSDGDSNMAQTIFSRHDKAEAFCNQLFFDKKWHEDEEDGTLKFKLTEDGEIIKVSQLSSGEKQMLILLLSTLTQNGRNYITFWDEPEISLHIGWQQQLIRIMRDLNPNMQLIIATHSPSILHEGWEQRAINVNDIKTKQK